MRNLLRLILPLLMVQGCAGNPVAQQLERSFDQPAQRAPSPATATAPKGTSQPRQSGSDSDDRSDRRTETQSPSATDSDQDRTGESKSETSSKAESDAPKPEDDQAGDSTNRDNAPEPKKAGTLPPSDLPKEPYRITIRLSAADPASPAEAVTRALRQAGVPFAVEQIEQIERNEP